MHPGQPLPGAYYGPAVPPAPRRKSRGCFCCLLSTFLTTLLGLVIFLGVLVLVLWLIFRPVPVKAYVTASLTQFNLTNVAGGNSIRYNLTTELTIRNPNRRIGIYYDRVEASAYFSDKRFAYTTLPSFYQGRKTTTTLYPAFSGTSAVVLSSSDVQSFNVYRQTGIFNVKLDLRNRIRFKLGSSFKTDSTTMKISCDMALPINHFYWKRECRVHW